jgi:hypothetical protein
MRGEASSVVPTPRLALSFSSQAVHRIGTIPFITSWGIPFVLRMEDDSHLRFQYTNVGGHSIVIRHGQMLSVIPRHARWHP